MRTKNAEATFEIEQASRNPRTSKVVWTSYGTYKTKAEALRRAHELFDPDPATWWRIRRTETVEVSLAYHKVQI